MKYLDVMQEEVLELNTAKGWFHRDRSFGEDIALLHSEVSETLEEFRKYGDVITRFENTIYGDKPVGVGSELADVLIRLLDTCERYGINLYEEYERKMKFNQKRPVRHGGKVL